MPFSNYSDLKSALGTWSFNRTDLPTADCIALAESTMRADPALILRTEEADNALSGTQGSRTIALPSGFVRPITLWRILINGDRGDPLDLVPASQMQSIVAQGIPIHWAIDGTNLVFERPLDQAYSYVLRCETTLAALSDINTTNFLLTTYPQLYLSASMLQCALWLEDAEQTQVWQAAYEVARQMVSRAEAKARGNPTLGVDAAMLRHRRLNIYTG